jgi:hypothetical protein
MGNENQSGSAPAYNVRAMIAAAIGGGGGVALGLLVSHFAGFQDFLPKLLAVSAGIVVGILLARFAARP